MRKAKIDYNITFQLLQDVYSMSNLRIRAIKHLCWEIDLLELTSFAFATSHLLIVEVTFMVLFAVLTSTGHR